VLQNYGAFFDTWGAGIIGPMILKGLKNGSIVDLSFQQWTYQVSLKLTKASYFLFHVVFCSINWTNTTEL